jgi:serine/threonine-protein kinase
MSPAADRNLLFGILAVQMDFVRRDDLITAMNAWLLDKDKPLGQILRDQGVLSVERCTLLDALVAEHLKQYAGDLRHSLAAVSLTRPIHLDLMNIDDADVRASLAEVTTSRSGPGPNATGPDVPPATLTPAVGNADDLTGPYVPPSTLPPHLRFHILRHHARGGLGEVFVARDEELKREVALKEIQERHSSNPDSRARFLLEAEVTGGLEHPGIVPVYGLGAYADGRPFYAMRLIRGSSLKDTFAQFHREKETLSVEQRTLRLRQLLGRFVDVCNVIAYAHSRGVLHRDLKPANIMLGKYGETLVVDWGLAKLLGREEAEATEGPLRAILSGDSTMTQTGQTLGTPAFMSPEQAAGELGRLGPRSDVYSLGATLYYLLTSQAPFAEGEVGEVLAKVRQGDFRLPRQVNREVPQALEAVCLRAMAHEPEQRYATSRELAEEIERWLADQPVAAYCERWTERLSRWTRRHQVLTRTAAAAAAAITLAAATAVFFIQQSRTEVERQRDLARANYQNAEENFLLAKQAVEDYLTRVSENTLLKAQDRQDLRELRKKLLEDALKFYHKFIHKRGDDPGQQAELAEAYSRVGFLTNEIGSKTEAIRAYEQALAIQERLAREHPEDAEAQYRHALTLITLGDLHRWTGEVDLALGLHRQARDIFRALTQAHPTVARYHHRLALTYNRIGAVQSEASPKESLAAYLEAVEIMERLTREQPSEVPFRSLLATLHNNIGLLQEDMNDRPEALRSYERAAEHFVKLMRDEPNDPRWQSLLAAAYNDISSLLDEMGDLPGGLRSLRKALDIHLDVTRRHPTVLEFQDHLARTHLNIGTLQRKNRDWKAALESMQRSLEIREKLALGNPRVFWYQSQWSAAYLNIGLVQTDWGHLEDAALAFQRGLAIQEPLVKDNPDKPHLANTLGLLFFRLGRVRLSQARPDAAVQAFRQAIQHHRAASVKVPQFQEFRRHLSDDLHELAKAQLALSRPAEAVAAMRECRDLWPDNSAELYRVACAIARCIPHVDQGKAAELTPAGQAERQRSADEALAVLRQAVDAGYDDAVRMGEDPDLEPLRQRSEFGKVLAEVTGRKDRKANPQGRR